MTDNEHEGNEFQKKAKRLLDESTSNLDAATLSRLHQARSQAIESTGRRSSPWFGWTTAGAAAASLTVGIIYMDQQQMPPLPNIYEDELQQAAAEEMELIDDLDFIAWLVLEEGEFDDVVKSS